MALPPARTAAPRPSRRRTWSAALVLAAVLGVLLTGQNAAADPGETPATAAAAAEAVAAKGHELEAVTERFNDAREELKATQAAAQQAAKDLEKARAELGRAQQAIRGVARSAYTTEGLSGFSALLTSDSADQFVDRVAVLQMVAGHQDELLDRAAAAGVGAAQAQAAAAESAARAQEVYDRVAGQQRDLEAQIADYQALYDSLSAQEQQDALAASAAAHGERASRVERSDSEPFSTTVVAGSGAAQAIVDAAMSQQGKPYVWAAAGPGSYDCSGLTQYAYAAAGIALPHSSRMQSEMGTPVSRSQLMPGDLVFFYSPVSHVGIYIGNGQMVHAPTFGDVVKVAGMDDMGAYSHSVRLV